MQMSDECKHSPGVRVSRIQASTVGKPAERSLPSSSHLTLISFAPYPNIMPVDIVDIFPRDGAEIGGLMSGCCILGDEWQLHIEVNEVRSVPHSVRVAK